MILQFHELLSKIAGETFAKEFDEYEIPQSFTGIGGKNASTIDFYIEETDRFKMPRSWLLVTVWFFAISPNQNSINRNKYNEEFGFL